MYVGIMTIAQDIIKPFVVPLPWIFEPTKINALKKSLFQGMRGLVEVKIADAKISQVSATVFSGLRKLKRLSLYKNNITVLAKVSK